MEYLQHSRESLSCGLDELGFLDLPVWTLLHRNLERWIVMDQTSDSTTTRTSPFAADDARLLAFFERSENWDVFHNLVAGVGFEPTTFWL